VFVSCRTERMACWPLRISGASTCSRPNCPPRPLTAGSGSSVKATQTSCADRSKA
jgi:hypothetical protein